jgi:ectoine hydroxylase-related dioxygenase (phytanoyl-CoA dioxygenase family)
MLTDAQRAAYDRDGFIVVPDVFSAEDIAELRRVTDEFVSASATAPTTRFMTSRTRTRRTSRGCVG